MLLFIAISIRKANQDSTLLPKLNSAIASSQHIKTSTLHSSPDHISAIKKHGAVIVLRQFYKEIIGITALPCLREAGSVLLCSGRKSPPATAKKVPILVLFSFLSCAQTTHFRGLTTKLRHFEIVALGMIEPPPRFSDEYACP